jgi:hypothetical protein
VSAGSIFRLLGLGSVGALKEKRQRQFRAAFGLRPLVAMTLRQ